MYIDFLILLIPTPLVSVRFAAASLLFVHYILLYPHGIYIPTISHSTVVQCIFAYPNLAYPDPRLSELLSQRK